MQMQIEAMLQKNCAEYLERYSADQLQVIAEYWETICFTRKTGRVSANIMQSEMAYWRRFDNDIVIQALREHIDQRPDYRESYTRGIMRNMQAEKDKGGGKQSRPNGYHKAPKQTPQNFKSEQRDLNHLIE